MYWSAISIGTHGKVRVIHYSDVIMGSIACLITSLTIVYSIVYSDADQRKHQSSASLAFVRGIHWGPGNSSHKRPVTRQMSPFDDVIMTNFVVTVAPNAVIAIASGVMCGYKVGILIVPWFNLTLTMFC